MEEQQYSIDDIFRKPLEGYREEPPAAAWQQVEQRLDGENDRRRFLRWPWVMLSLLVVVSCVWVVVGLSNYKGRSNNQYTASNDNSNNNIYQQTATTSAAHEVAATNTATKPQASTQEAAQGQDAAAATIVPASPQPVSELQAPAAAPTQAVPASSSHQLSTTPVEAAVNSTTEKALAPRIDRPDAPGLHPVSARLIQEAVKLAPAATLAKAETPTAPPVRKTLVPTQQLTYTQSGGMSVEEPKHTPETSVSSQQLRHLMSRETEPVSPLTQTGKLTAAKTRTLSAPEQLYADNSAIVPVPVDASRRHRKVVEEPVVAPQAKPKQDIAATPPQQSAAIAPKVQPTPAEKPAEAPKEDKPADPVKPDLQSPRAKLPISLAALVGYEAGLKTPVDSRYAASLRLLWQAGQSVAVGIQPALRIGHVQTLNLSKAKWYKNDTISVRSFRTIDESPSIYNGKDTIYNYVIEQNFDSILVPATSTGGSFWELEIPLIVHHKLTKSWYVYGGPSVTLGGKLSYNDGGAPKRSSVYRKDSLAQSQPLPAESFNNYFGKTDLESYSNYKPVRNLQDPATARFGYLLGVGYTWKNLMAELSVHQQFSGYKAVAVPVRDVYTSPYVRISLGYQLFAPKANKNAVK